MAMLERWLRGETPVRITGALPAAFLNRCVSAGIPFFQAEPVDACTLRLRLRTRDLARARSVAARCGCTLEAGRPGGAPEVVRRLRSRVALCVGLRAAALAWLWSSLYIWDIRVTVNDSDVPDQEILRVLDGIGVKVGSFWPAFSSDRIRSQALPELPGLCWLTVNVHGSRAEVIARAAVPAPEIQSREGTGDVTAARAGIVTEIRALEGEALVRPGDTVTEGQVLISGTRPGLEGQTDPVQAKGEVTARTWYELTACTPLTAEKCTVEKEKLRFALILGRRRINFYTDSGISLADCDKITQIRPLAWEGVFSLPLALVTERIRIGSASESQRDAEALRRMLEEQLQLQLEDAVGDNGQIVSQTFSESRGDGMLYLTLRAECLERIDRGSGNTEN